MESKGSVGTDYYPGQIYTFSMVRDSKTTVFNLFFPMMILIVFNSLVLFTKDFDNMIANSSIVMLAYIGYLSTV